MSDRVELVIKYLPGEGGYLPDMGERQEERKASKETALMRQIIGAIPGGNQALGITGTVSNVASSAQAVGGADVVAAASGALTLAALAYKLGKRAYEAWREYDKQQRQSAELKRRAGYNTRG